MIISNELQKDCLRRKIDPSFIIQPPINMSTYMHPSLEAGRAWDRARRSGLGLLLHKTQSLSLRVGLGPKPNFFIYVVKPEPKVWSPSPTQAQKNQAQPTSTPAGSSNNDLLFWRKSSPKCTQTKLAPKGLEINHANSSSSFSGGSKMENFFFNVRADSPQPVWPGANPTIMSYNASVVIIYNATNSVACC
jgi:hypothetical protein